MCSYPVLHISHMCMDLFYIHIKLYIYIYLYIYIFIYIYMRMYAIQVISV